MFLGLKSVNVRQKRMVSLFVAEDGELIDNYDIPYDSSWFAGY